MARVSTWIIQRRCRASSLRSRSTGRADYVANYNCPSPSGIPVYAVGAVGGIEKDPLGNMLRQNQPAKDLYGSSYAAALVAGALISK